MARTYGFMRWLNGIDTAEFLERLRTAADAIGLSWESTCERGVFLGGWPMRQGRWFRDPYEELPKEPPGFSAIYALAKFPQGDEAFTLSISSEDKEAELFLGGKVYVALLKISEKFSPYWIYGKNYWGSENLELALRQYSCLKQLHEKMRPDRTWALDEKQDLSLRLSDEESIDEALCWLSSDGAKKLIRHLEERRSAMEEDRLRVPESGRLRWEIFEGAPPPKAES